ncbi:MAG: tRNA-(ms[2]io[6]A)-hydroxylase [Planctomycetota bacterium]|nr:MAG: tRNA-(ms[2]io[6]A)-hydroxylase [Planctomycetota bacterium]
MAAWQDPRGLIALRWSTGADWADLVLADPLALLDDHAHCELGAAAAAQSFLSRHPSIDRVAEKLSATAIEELRHFREVHEVLRSLGGCLSSRAPNAYVEALHAAVRATRARDGDPLIDRLLVSALIERRSLERFELLAARASGALRELYARLVPSELGHAALFVHLCFEIRGEAATVGRLARIQELEAEVARAQSRGPRIHSGFQERAA